MSEQITNEFEHERDDEGRPEKQPPRLHEWERVCEYSEDHIYTYRMEVPGGWLYRIDYCNDYPDPNWESKSHDIVTHRITFVPKPPSP